MGGWPPAGGATPCANAMGAAMNAGRQASRSRRRMEDSFMGFMV
jgi:hypothetical protein